MDVPEQPKASGPGRWVPWAVLAVCLCLTVGVAVGSHVYIRRSQRHRFEARTHELQVSIQRRLEDYAQNLHAGQAWVDGRGAFSQEVWGQMVQSLRLDLICPGHETMAFLRAFPEEERTLVLAEERRVNGREPVIFPEGTRDRYVIITRMAPLDSVTSKRLGGDTYVSEARREMALRATDSGDVAVSRGVTLFTDKSDQVLSFLLFKAVYRGGGVPATLEERRRKLVGFVAMASRYRELITSSLPPAPRDVAVNLVVPVESRAELPVYSEMRPGTGVAGLDVEERLSFGGQVWKIRFQATPSFVHPLEKWGPLANLLVGFLASGLIFALISSLMNRRQEAESIAESMTESLSSALAYLHNLLEAATQVSIVMTDSAGVVQVFNSGAERILGWQSSEVVGRETPLLWHDPEELETRKKALEATGLKLEGPFSVFAHFARENRMERIRWHWITRTGERRLVEMVVTCVMDPMGKFQGYLGIAVDITEQARAQETMRVQEEQLQQSQKMDAIGQLAGGVAHDFNNMLAGILGSAELLAEEIPGDAPHRKLVETIIKASERAAELTSKLLAFSRKGKLVSTALDLHRIVQDTMALLERSVDKRIEIRQSLRARNPQVVGDPSQLENALLNLCINARDAMPDGGTLMVETEDVQLREALSDPAGFHVEAGPYVRLSVRDTGHGIPAEIRDRIFEPFFTTKVEGRGTGLGLSAVYGIVKSHRGALGVESQPGKGSAFSILLPLDEMPRIQANREEIREAHRGEGTILVIDDEDMIRSTTARILESMGYQVLQAANGAEGIRAFEAHRPEIRLVILDLVMPGISGRETFQRLRRLSPKALIIAASGFANDQSVGEMMDEGLVGFLHKPYGIRELVDAIDRALIRSNE